MSKLKSVITICTSVSTLTTFGLHYQVASQRIKKRVYFRAVSLFSSRFY